ncbi:UNVERIFIED_CONTAM: hypothetical protein Sindi_2995600, partial [Sesamum indicum]
MIGIGSQKWPTWRILARLNGAAAPSYLFKSFAPIPKSDERFARQYRCGPPPEFPLASPRSGIVHHLSEDQGRSALHPSGGIAPVSFLTPYGFARPLTRTHVRLLGPCFKTGRMGSPLASAGSAQLPRHAVGARCPPRSGRRRSAGISTARALAAASIRAGPRPEPIGGPALAVPHPTGAHRRPHPLPSRQFQALFDSLFKVLFIFPSRYLFAIGLSPVFSLGRNLPPDWGCISKQPDSPTAPRGAAGSGHDGALTLSGALSRGLGPGPPLRTLLQTTIRTAKPPDSQVGLFPVRSPLLGESLRWRLWVQRDARADDAERGTTARELSVQPPLVVTSVAAGSHLGRPRAGAHGRPMSAPHATGRGDAMRDAQADVPWPNGFGRNLRSKTRWFTGFCNSHQVSHFATFFIDARAEISVAESRFDIRETSPPPVHPADGATVRRTLRSVFLGACRAGGSLARTSSAFARAGGGGDRTGAFAPRPGPDFICNVFA